MDSRKLRNGFLRICRLRPSFRASVRRPYRLVTGAADCDQFSIAHPLANLRHGESESPVLDASHKSSL